MLEDNKALVRRLFDEPINHQNLAALNDIISSTMVVGPHLPVGPEGMKSIVTGLHNAFGGLRYTIEDLIAEDDTVAVRLSAQGTHVGKYEDVPPTSKPAAFAEMMFFRIADQKIEEWWLVADRLALLRDIGANISSADKSSIAGTPPAPKRRWGFWHRS